MKNRLLHAFCLMVTLVMLIGILPVASLAEEPVVLTLLTCDASAGTYIDHFNQMNDRIQIKVEYVAGSWQETNQKLITMIAAQTPPDIVFMSATMTPDFASSLMDLTDRVAADLDMDEFVPGIFDAIKVDGKIYGVPKDIRVTQTWYNKNLFDAYGLPYPSSDWGNAWTIEEWQDTVAKLSGELDGVKTYGNFIDWRWVRMIPYMLDAGMQTVPFNEAGESVVNGDAFKGILTMLQNQIKDGVAPSPADLQEAGRAVRFNNGTLAMQHTGTWDYGPFSANESITLAACPTPGGKTNFWMDTWAALKDSKHPDEVWEALKYLCSSEYWEWVLMNDPNCCFPIRNDIMELAKDYLFPTLDADSRACLFQSLEYAVPYVGHLHYAELESAMNEVTSLIALGAVEAADGADMIAAKWEDILDE